MSYIYDAPNLTGGADQFLVQMGTAVPSFFIGLLLFVFGVIFLGGTNTQKRRTGYADYPMWCLMASLCTMLIALTLSITAGIISLETLGVVVTLTILSGVWYFLSKGRGEI